MLTSLQSSMVPSSNVWQLWQQLHQNLTYLYDCWFPTWHASPSQKSQESNSILSHKTEGHGRNSPLSWRATCCNYFKLLDTNLFLQAEKKTTSIPVQNQAKHQHAEIFYDARSVALTSLLGKYVMQRACQEKKSVKTDPVESDYIVKQEEE